MEINLVWFREDLRIEDNPALYHASKTGLVAAVYIISPSMLQAHDVSQNKIIFILDGLTVLQHSLEKLNINLKILIVENSIDIQTEIQKYANQINASSVYFNIQYELNEKKRDYVVTNHLEKYNLKVKQFHDQCLFMPGSILTQQNDFYQVFTPFKKICWKKFQNGYLPQPLLAPKKQSKFVGESSKIPKKFAMYNFQNQQVKIKAGEEVARQQLKNFLEAKIYDYKNNRDFPAIEGTSRLSPYFAAGMISVQQCIHAIYQLNPAIFFNLDPGPLTWINELLWREFYRHIIVGFPRVSAHKPFKLETDEIQWDYNQEFFDLWKLGCTGVPIVDAAMRQLSQTGWMHNRLRMIVAMFFSKNLFLNWRLGEKYFMQTLIDGDLASNNGGWQWCASTGVDAAPYFRIFNPYLQSQRFDPTGEFIKKYVPELAKLDNKLIHDPSSKGGLFLKKINYNKPIVDLTASKRRVIQAFKALRK